MHWPRVRVPSAMRVTAIPAAATTIANENAASVTKMSAWFPASILISERRYSSPTVARSSRARLAARA